VITMLLLQHFMVLYKMVTAVHTESMETFSSPWCRRCPSQDGRSPPRLQTGGQDLVINFLNKEELSGHIGSFCLMKMTDRF